MSILDTFTILFDSQGADVVKRSQDEATKSAEKTGVALEETGQKGVEAGEAIAHENSKLAESFDLVKEHAGEMASRLVEHAFEVAAAFQAMFAVEKLVDTFFETAEQSDQLGERAKSIGVNVEQLDAWGNAAKRVGGSADAFGESLINVNRQMARMEATGKSRILPFFKELGVAMEKNGKPRPIFELLPELAKATEGKSKQESAGALRGIGFDEGTIRLLQRGGKELDALIDRQKKLGLVTAEDAETAEKFNIEWDDVKQVFHSVTVELDTYLLPILEELLNGIEVFVEFLRDHKDLVIGFFIGLGAAAIYAADAFGLLDITLAILTSPITLIIAAVAALIAAFALLYDDIKAFTEGHNSLVGKLAERWPIVGDAVRGFVRVLGEARDFVVGVVSDLLAWIKQIPEGFRQWSEIISEVFAVFISKSPAVVAEFKAFFAALARAAKTEIGLILEIFRALWEGIKFFFGLIGALIVDPEHALQRFSDKARDLVKNVTTEFPKLTEAFKIVGKEFDVIGEAIIRLWDRIGSAISGTIGRVEGAFSFVKNGLAGGLGEIGGEVRGVLPSWLGGTSSAASSPMPDLPGAQAALAGANVPLAAQTAGSIAASGGGTVNQTVSIGGTTVNATTNADPALIAKTVNDSLSEHMGTAINQLGADGVSH